MNVFADLHTHSTASDGVLAPADLLKAAKAAGLSAIGLTDHDTVKGLEESMAVAAEIGIQFVPGIELSCGWPDSEISLHVLGLFIDPRASSLVQYLEDQRIGRYSRAFKILDRLEAVGINMKPLRAEFEAQPDKLLGRPHVARYLVEIGAVAEFQEAFEKYLKRGMPAHVPKPHLLPEVGIDIIHRAGGMAFIAHPGLIANWEESWVRLSTLPWDGLEVFYSEHDPEKTEYFRRLSQQHGFLMTGGSDYHGEYGKHASKLGVYGLEEAAFAELSARARLKSASRQAIAA